MRVLMLEDMAVTFKIGGRGSFCGQKTQAQLVSFEVSTINNTKM
jgi:hypothetical protein